MTNKELKKLKSLLKKDKKGLDKKLSKLKRVDFGDDIDSGEEEADEVEEMVTNKALIRLFEKRLNGINNALAKIEEGTYGTCQDCKKPISVKLLQVDPESELCRACKLKNG